MLGTAAEAVTQIIQCPPALAANSLLAGAALAVQAHADIEIDGRTFPVSENFVTVARSGERKTATDSAVLAPHQKRQRGLRTIYETQIADHEAEVAAWKKCREEALRKKGREAKRQALRELGPEPQGPVDAILTVEEPTYEGLVKALANGWPSMGLFSDEGGRFLGGHGMSDDNRLKTVAGLSKFWDGSPVTRSRGGDGNFLLFGRRLSFHLMLQPLVGSHLFGDPLLTEQGFLSRCLVAYPLSTIGQRPYFEADLHESPAMRRYYARMMDTLEVPLPLAEGTRNELSPRKLPLAPDAKAPFIKFHDHVEALMREGQPLAVITGFASKAAEHAVRLAGILALVADLQAVLISKSHLEAGILLARFYLDEALRLFGGVAEHPDLALAESLLLWAREHGHYLLYPVLVYQRGPNPIRDKATAKRVLQLLESHGWVRYLPEGPVIDGIRRRDVWEVRP